MSASEKVREGQLRLETVDLILRNFFLHIYKFSLRPHTLQPRGLVASCNFTLISEKNTSAYSNSAGLNFFLDFSSS